MSNYAFDENERLIIENAKILFPNFSGRANRYNREGWRNFCVVIDDKDIVHILRENGWNVKMLQDDNNLHGVKYYVPVAINFESHPFAPPAAIYSVRNGELSTLTEDTIDMLDGMTMTNVDMTLRPRKYWDKSRSIERVKAYLHNMYVTFGTNRLAEKYSSVMPSADVCLKTLLS